MAVAKSTIIKITPTTAGALLNWSSLASNDNNVYFDVNAYDVSKMIFLVAHSNSSDVGTTAGFIFFGASASAALGSSGEETYSGNEAGRRKVKSSPPTTPAKEALTISSVAASISISAFGGFEAARLKDSDGYINVTKGKATSDLGRVKICAILVP